MNFIRTLQDLLPTDRQTFMTWIRRRPLAAALFSALCLNLLLAPAVYATAAGDVTRKTAYAIGILGLITIALSVYLFTVIFQPERF